MPDVKIKKDGQEYGIGVIPQSMYDDVEDLKDTVNRGSVSVTSDGVKTWSQLLDSLFALISASKITNDSVLVFTYTNGGKGYYRLAGNYLATGYGELRFTYTRTTSTTIVVETCEVKSSGSKIYYGGNNVITDNSENTSYGKIELFY